MNRATFETIAAVIKRERDAWANSINDDMRFGVQMALDNTARKLCEEFALTNPDFDRCKFLTACGFGE